MESIANVIIFHRKLGCQDESATDEEQSEKILFYYPNTSLYWQVSAHIDQRQFSILLWVYVCIAFKNKYVGRLD